MSVPQKMNDTTGNLSDSTTHQEFIQDGKKCLTPNIMIKWHKTLNRDGSQDNAMTALLNTKPGACTIVARETPEKKMEFAIARFEDLLQYDEANLHETITNIMPCKLHLDIDFSCAGINSEDLEKFEDWFSLLRYVIRDVIDGMFGVEIELSDIVVVSRDRADKKSRHVIVDHWAANTTANKAFVTIMKKFEFKNCIDPAMGYLTHNMSMVGQVKNNNKNKIDSYHRFHNSLVTYTEHCEMLDCSEFEIHEVVEPVKVDNAEMQTLLDQIPYLTDHMIRSKANNVIQFDRVRPGHCRVCQRTHDKDNSMYVVVTNDGVFEKCHRSLGRSIMLGFITREAETQMINDMHLYLDGDVIAQQVINCRQCELRSQGKKAEKCGCWLKQLFKGKLAQPEQPRKDIDDYRDGDWAIRAGMGRGKTEALKRLFKELINSISQKQKQKDEIAFHKIKEQERQVVELTKIEPKMQGFEFAPQKEIVYTKVQAKILVISMRKTFTTDFCKKLECNNYLDIKGDIKEDHCPVVVQLESLHRVKITPRDIDLLVLDEVESILEQFNSGTMKERYIEVVESFKTMFMCAKRVICMDANLRETTVQLLQKLRPQLQTLTYAAIPRSETQMYSDDFDDTIEYIVQELNAGKHLFIVTNWGVKKCKQINEIIQTRCQGKVGKIYHKRSDQQAKLDDFANISEAWKVDYVIASPTLGPGISFQEEWFDSTVAIMGPRSTSVFYARQMLRRVRSLRDNKLVICIQRGLPGGPRSHYEVAQILRDKKSDLEIKLPHTFDADGNRVFKHNFMYDNLVDNKLTVSIDRQNFANYFVNQEYAANPGIRFELLDVKAPRLEKSNNRVYAKKVATDIAVELANAPVLSESEFDVLAQKEETNVPMSGSEMASLEKMRLADYYHVWPAGLTVDQFQRLPKLKKQFKNTRDELKYGLDKIGQMQAEELAQELIINDSVAKAEMVIDKSNYTKHKMANEILVAMSYIDLWGAIKSQTPTRDRSRDEIIRGIERVVALGTKKICEHFEKKIVDPTKWSPKLYLKNGLDFVNSIIEPMFGIKIIAANSKAVWYKIELLRDFTLYGSDFIPGYLWDERHQIADANVVAMAGYESLGL